VGTDSRRRFTASTFAPAAQQRQQLSGFGAVERDRPEPLGPAQNQARKSAPRWRGFRKGDGSVRSVLHVLLTLLRAPAQAHERQPTRCRNIAGSVLSRTSNRLKRQKAKAVIGMSVILVVDDDSATRLLVRAILEIAGHEVIEAPHGSAALELITPQSLPDVVVTDLTMPILDGKELIAQLRSGPVTAKIPIVVVSGNLVEARTLKATGLVEAVVSKPFVAANLAQCIHAVTSQQITRPRVA
jgi:CheY-like chemotaxis protein